MALFALRSRWRRSRGARFPLLLATAREPRSGVLLGEPSMNMMKNTAAVILLLGVFGAMPMTGNASPGSCIASASVTAHEDMNQHATETTVRTTASEAGRLQGTGLSGLKLATNHDNPEQEKKFRACISSCNYRLSIGRLNHFTYSKCKSDCCVRFNRMC